MRLNLRQTQRWTQAGVAGLSLIFSISGVAQEFLDAEENAPERLEETPTVFDDFTVEERIREGGFVIPGLIKTFPQLGPVAEGATFYLEPRTYYFYRKNGDGTISEAWAAGGSLSYESGWWREFLQFGTTAYTSQKLHGPAERDGTGLLQANQQSYTALGQLHLKARIGPALATLYRQELDLPYVNRDDIRMTPRTFEGYTIAVEELEGWSFVAGHLTRMKGRTSSTFEPMSVSTGAMNSNEGVTLGGFLYDFNDEARIGAINFYGWDSLNIFYTEAQIDHTCANRIDLSSKWQFSAQSDVGNSLAGARNGQLYGVEFSVAQNSLIGTVAITSRRGDEIIKPWGGDPSFNSLIVSDFDRVGEDAIRLGLSYDFAELGLTGWSAFTSYTWGNTPDTGPYASPDQSEFDFTLDYQVEEGPFENCWLRFRVADNDFDGGVLDRLDFRIIANYSIEF